MKTKREMHSQGFEITSEVGLNIKSKIKNQKSQIFKSIFSAYSYLKFYLA